MENKENINQIIQTNRTIADVFLREGEGENTLQEEYPEVANFPADILTIEELDEV